MDVGETISVRIRARVYCNETGAFVRIGERYRLQAEGSWRDMFITSGPNGYGTPWYSFGQRLAAGLRRVPNARWFVLVGAVRGADESPFVTGAETRTLMPATGPLVCFANDVPGFYWLERDMTSRQARTIYARSAETGDRLRLRVVSVHVAKYVIDDR